MPLHLLSKKSWNPYAPAAIERVKADEAASLAASEASDARLAAHDSARRLALLRGLPSPSPSPAPTSPEQTRRDHESERPSKRRRRAGEDDTDADIRHARADVDARAQKRDMRVEPADAPLTDRAGHIQLFAAGDANAARGAEKRKEREAEDRVTLRFDNAAGFGKAAGASPWYAERREYSGTEIQEETGRNAFGKEDKGRHGRDKGRVAAADPMAAMQAAQTRLKEVERERARVNQEREDDLRMLKAEQTSHRSRRTDREERRKHEHRHRSRRSHDDQRGHVH